MSFLIMRSSSPKRRLRYNTLMLNATIKEVEKFAKNLTQLTQEEFMRLREPQKQVVIKNIGNMTRLHSKRAMDYKGHFRTIFENYF